MARADNDTWDLATSVGVDFFTRLASDELDAAEVDDGGEAKNFAGISYVSATRQTPIVVGPSGRTAAR
jgi:hypothetical protein